MLEEKANSITQDELNSYKIGYISSRTEYLQSSECKPCEGCWYFEDIRAYVCISTDTIYIKDLTNAMRRGLECPIYQLSVRSSYSLGLNWDGTPICEHPIDLLVWLEEQRIPTIAALYQRIQEPIEMEGIAYLIYSDRACSTYSPFVKVKPIQTPKKWTRAYVWKAILSGQIYRGKINHIYTDDYRRDALRDCYEDQELSMENLIDMAEDLLTGRRTHSVGVTEHDDGTAEIKLYDLQSSYTLYYDPERRR